MKPWLVIAAALLGGIPGAFVVLYATPKCVPGEYKLCELEKNVQGYQQCRPDGRRYHECLARREPGGFTLQCPDTVDTHSAIVFGQIPLPGSAEAHGLTDPRVTIWVEPADGSGKVWTSHVDLSPKPGTQLWSAAVRLGNPYGISHRRAGTPLTFKVTAAMGPSGQSKHPVGYVSDDRPNLANFNKHLECLINRGPEPQLRCKNDSPRIVFPKPHACLVSTDGQLVDPRCDPADRPVVTAQAKLDWLPKVRSDVRLLKDGEVVQGVPATMEPPLDLGKIPNLTAGLYQLSVQRANHDCDSSVWFDVEAPAAAERTSDLAGDVAVRR